MKKCLLVIQNLSKSGSPLTFLHIVKALNDDYKIDVVVTSALSIENDLFYYSEYQKNRCNITLLKINTHKFINRLFPYFAYRKIKSIVKRNEYDFVLSNILEVSSMLDWSNINIKNYFYSLDALLLLSKYRLINYRRKKMIERVENSCHFIALSSKCISKNNNSKNEIQYLVDYPDIEYKKDKKKFNDNCLNLGLIGYFCDKKNQMFALKVLNELKKVNSNVKLHLMGYYFDNDKKYYESLLHFINKNNLENNVNFVDKNMQKNDFFNQIDLLLCPSKYEGLGLVILESQCRQTPVLVSDNIPYESQLGGVIFKPLQIDVWVNEILSKKYEKNIIKSDLDLKTKFEIGLKQIIN